MLVKPKDLPTAEELRTGKSERPEVQAYLDSPARRAIERVTEWTSRMWWAW